MLTRSQAPVLQFDQEIEKTARRLRKQTKSKAMGEQGERTMLEYSMPTMDGARSSIIRPTIEANNFEIKPALISMIQTSIQFGGLPSDDPNLHLSKFLQLCDTIKYNGVSDDAIRLRLFPFSLRDKANQWLTSLPPGSITTWNQLTQQFLAKYFPPSKSAKLRIDISTFVQSEFESLYEAWERFQELLRKCPHHGLPIYQQVQIFYNGLSTSNRSMIDAAANGTIWRKTPTQAYELIEEMASNSYQWQNDRHVKKQVGAFAVDTSTAIFGHLEALTKKVDSLMLINKSPSSFVCDLCGRTGHMSEDCQEGNPFSPETEEAKFVGNPNRQKYDPYSNTYNPGWRDHPNLSWGGKQNNFRPQQPQASSFKGPERKPSLEETMIAFMNNTEARLQSQDAIMKNLETQISQLANLLNERAPGSLPGKTEPNPKEHAKAITLRSGKEIAGNPLSEQTKSDEENIDQTKKTNYGEVENKKPTNSSPGKFEGQVKCSTVPFPQRLKNFQHDKQFSKFLEMFKKLQINIPFAEAISQMPKYAKFLKEILANKRKLEDFEMVRLNEECSAILLRKLPPKLKDPGSFTIPCSIGSSYFKALCDLGASINLMPLSVLRKLGMQEPKPTTVSLQLADRSITYPRGVVEDVLVKVDKFIFPVDFIVLDMEEDEEMPIILGRPFLATGKTIIDVHQGKLTLRLDDEEVVFKVFNSMKNPSSFDSCHFIDTIDATDLMICDYFKESRIDDVLEKVLTMDNSDFLDTEDTTEALMFLEAGFPKENWKLARKYEALEREDLPSLKSSIEEAPELELKPLPSNLKYAFLNPPSSLPVIISSSLTDTMEEKLLRILRDNKEAFGWTIHDIKGISPSICTHKIFMEERNKPLVQPQRRLNPSMKEVVKKEVIKLLDAGIIYPISDSPWVSPVQVVPKKGGTTVMKNEKDELIAVRKVTGWRMCIDYRKLNEATRKDHFPLPFIDQMLEKLSGHEYYCCLDGYSGYMQIPMAPEDQEKTTFTCPYGTFAYRRMPFGLCNAPATFQRCMMAIFSDLIEDCIEILWMIFLSLDPLLIAVCKI